MHTQLFILIASNNKLQLCLIFKYVIMNGSITDLVAFISSLVNQSPKCCQQYIYCISIGENMNLMLHSHSGIQSKVLQAVTNVPNTAYMSYPNILKMSFQTGKCVLDSEEQELKVRVMIFNFLSSTPTHLLSCKCLPPLLPLGFTFSSVF